ncbi:arginase family protein [Candidatus Nitrosotalea bavarica]|uniref:arginase family protein n=1 Tax=Candidatus Nitrosotalea bavarica TaxID=1903277 RepID=UPI000C7122AE|nr:arginase family protein [Candidatus Nitrosotalea bavarica]
MKICWANTDNFDEADIVIIGIPDESKSHALRKGTSEAPHKIREISSIRDSYKRGDVISLGLPLDGITKKVYDYGNIERSQIEYSIDNIVSKSRIPISIGGDHSISTELIKSISKKFGPLSLVYFDAHPDFVSSVQGYYGSVFHDVLQYIDIKSSIMIGVRTPEKEEIDNIKKYDLPIITPFDIIRQGIQKTEEIILNRIGKNTYVSLDMDVIDPAFAPGVSVPVPLGLRNIEVALLLKSIVKKGICGLDIMEVCPNYDIKDRTSHLASRIISEVISSA